MLLDAAKRRQRSEQQPRSLEDAGPSLDGCPITPLGRRTGRYFFLTPVGELRDYRANDLNRQGIKDLFDGRLEWLQTQFPAYDQSGMPKPQSWSVDASSTWLIRACADAGLFDPAMLVRGPGVWRDSDGRIIVHAGDELLIDGRWERGGKVHQGVIYAAAPNCERPADTALGKEAGQALLATIGRWRFERDIGPELVLGFMGAAMLGGAPFWRVHMLAVGQRGSGKTWLSDLVKAALGGGAIDANNVTEASLRQALTGQARAIVLDEAESDEHSAARIQKVIHLLRLMSSGEGAKAMRGSVGGTAQVFQVTGCAWLSAILPPALKPQDRSRITTVCLVPLPVGSEAAGAADEVHRAIQEARKASPGLRARAVEHWQRFQDTFGRYRAAFMGKGCDSRDADRIATLLAGRDLLIHDEVPDSDSLEEETARFLELINDAAEQEEESEGQQCLTHLYSSPVDLWHSGARKLVSELLLEARSLGTGAAARSEITKLGLRIHKEAGEETWLLVANQHVGLERVFRDTRWAGGGWKTALGYLAGARPWPVSLRFAGVKQRAIAIPRSWLPRDDEENEDDGGGVE